MAEEFVRIHLDTLMGKWVNVHGVLLDDKKELPNKWRILGLGGCGAFPEGVHSVLKEGDAETYPCLPPGSSKILISSSFLTVLTECITKSV